MSRTREIPLDYQINILMLVVKHSAFERFNAEVSETVCK